MQLVTPHTLCDHPLQALQMQRVYEEEDEADDAQDEADEELERRRRETDKAAAQPKPMDQVRTPGPGPSPLSDIPAVQAICVHCWHSVPASLNLVSLTASWHVLPLLSRLQGGGMYFLERVYHRAQGLFSSSGSQSASRAAVAAATEMTPTAATDTPVPVKDQPLPQGKPMQSS